MTYDIEIAERLEEVLEPHIKRLQPVADLNFNKRSLRGPLVVTRKQVVSNFEVKSKGAEPPRER